MRFARFLVLTVSYCRAEVQFLGGTATGPRPLSHGRVTVNDPRAFRFDSKAGSFSIPFAQINLVEYGQKVDRRVAAAILVSPLLLMSKSRKHFVTIGYRDSEGEQQSLVFRVPKEELRVLLSALEAKTGRPVRFLDVDARKQMGGV
jgi:hypothetical protein